MSIRTVFTDTITSAVTNLGTMFRDKSVGRSYSPIWRERDALESLYDHNGLAACIVDAVVDDAFTAGFEIKSSSDETADERVRAEWRRVGLLRNANMGWKRARVVGGAGVVLGPPDSITRTAWEQPPPPGLPIGWTSVITPDNASIEENDNPLSGDYLQPRYYNVGTTRIHPGWVLHFSGRRRTSRTMHGKDSAWGLSVLQQVWDPLLAYLTAAQALSHVIEELKDTTYQVPDLFAIAGMPEGLANLKKRVELMQQIGGNTGVRILDQNETWATSYGSVAGFADALDPLQLHLAAVSRTPVSRLFGRGAAGLANQTESDRENWDEYVHSQADHVLRAALEKALLRTPGGHAFELEFGRLRTMTATETAALELTQAQADAARIADGILTPSEVRSSRFEGDSTWQLDADYVPPSDTLGLGGDAYGEDSEDEIEAPAPVIETTTEAPPNGETPVSVAAAAEALGVSPATIRGLLKRNALAHVYATGAGYRVLQSEVFAATRRVAE